MHVSSRRGFTLIELLVVIAIIAILAVVVVLTLNPAELLRQSRDSNRVSDMATLNSAINLYNTDQSGSRTYSLGLSNTVYLSIPDPNATTTAGTNCALLGLPALPSLYTYHCAASSTYRNTNGTGWIPVNLSSISSGAPLGSLPVDPTNNSSSRLYYTYTTNGSQFETTAVMESQKYQLGGSNDVISTDGGALASVYEKGSKFGLEPLDYGDTALVGFWPLNEGANSIAYDDSGNNATGSWNGTQAGTSGYYSPGKVRPWAGAFDGSTDYVNGPLPSIAPNQSTITAWTYVNSVASGTISWAAALYTGPQLFSIYSTGMSYWPDTGNYSFAYANNFLNSWNFVAAVWNYQTETGSLYINGQQVTTGASALPRIQTNNTFQIGTFNSVYYPGIINNVRIYNRALSAAQIAAMYNGGK